MKKLLTLFSFIVFISLIIFFQSCKEESPSEPQNQAPKIENLSANPSTINTNGQTTLTCVATDKDGDNLTTTWTSQNGTFPNGSTGSSVVWQAPSTNGSYAMTATVSDGKLTDIDIVNVNVENSGVVPQPPVLLSPTDNSENLSLPVLLVWNMDQNTNSYTLQVSKDSLFTQVIYNQNLITNTSQQMTQLSTVTKYYWRVNATNNYGTSNWSTIWSFAIRSIPCPGTPTVTYENKTYNTVLIGEQCWMKENLDVGILIQGDQDAMNDSIVEKYCYNNNLANCNIYGGLYQWNEAMHYSNSQGAQGICPAGWHIPTVAEFETLANTVNGDATKLEEIGQGAGTNTSGFSALFAGYRASDWGFLWLDHFTLIWSSTQPDTSIAYNLWIGDNNSVIGLEYAFETKEGFSVRCIKD